MSNETKSDKALSQLTDAITGRGAIICTLAIAALIIVVIVSSFVGE